MAAFALTSLFLLPSKCWRRDRGQLAAVCTENILTVTNDLGKEGSFKDLNENTSCMLLGENIFGMSGGVFALIWNRDFQQGC